jgi:hypothetical protein
MKLHGNAALSWNGRRQLVRRVVVEGCSLRLRPRPLASVCAALGSGLVDTGSRARLGCSIGHRRRVGSQIAPGRSGSR